MAREGLLGWGKKAEMDRATRQEQTVLTHTKGTRGASGPKFAIFQWWCLPLAKRHWKSEGRAGQVTSYL